MRERFNQWMSGAKAGGDADMPMEPPPCGPAGIGVAVEHPRFAQEGPRTVAKSLLCSPGGGAGNNQRHARQRDCRRPAGNLTRY